jgi:hypothetical protein
MGSVEARGLRPVTKKLVELAEEFEVFLQDSSLRYLPTEFVSREHLALDAECSCDLILCQPCLVSQSPTLRRGRKRNSGVGLSDEVCERCVAVHVCVLHASQGSNTGEVS